jgi:hypothetical protein
MTFFSPLPSRMPLESVNRSTPAAGSSPLSTLMGRQAAAATETPMAMNNQPVVSSQR